MAPPSASATTAPSPTEFDPLTSKTSPAARPRRGECCRGVGDQHRRDVARQRVGERRHRRADEDGVAHPGGVEQRRERGVEGVGAAPEFLHLAEHHALAPGRGAMPPRTASAAAIDAGLAL